jgi:hypothetical protein
MNPHYCPACGGLYLISNRSSIRDVEFFACTCGTEWKVVYGERGHIDVTVYPSINLNSD